MEQVISFKIENFEGPLDLLLNLITRNRMTLLDVRLSLIIDQYLDFIGSIGPEQLDPASEFIEMAARLVYMKSVALLPRKEESEELRKELIGQLVEYRLAKEAAAKLRYMQEGLFFIVRETLDMEFNEEYKGVHDKELLLLAIKLLTGRVTAFGEVGMETFEEIVTAPVVSVSSRVIYIMRSLRKGLIKNVGELFEKIKVKSEAVATFLGLLELINAKRITVDDNGEIKTPLRLTGMKEG